MQIPMNVLALAKLARHGRGGKRWLFLDALENGTKVASATDGQFLACLAWHDAAAGSLEDGQRCAVSPEAALAAWHAMGGKGEAEKLTPTRGTTCLLLPGFPPAPWRLSTERRYHDGVDIAWRERKDSQAYADWREAFKLRAELLARAQGTRPLMGTPHGFTERMAYLADARIGSLSFWPCPTTTAAFWAGWADGPVKMIAFGMLNPGSWDSGHDRSGNVGADLAIACPFMTPLMEAIDREADRARHWRDEPDAPLAGTLRFGNEPPPVPIGRNDAPTVDIKGAVATSYGEAAMKHIDALIADPARFLDSLPTNLGKACAAATVVVEEGKPYVIPDCNPTTVRTGYGPIVDDAPPIEVRLGTRTIMLKPEETLEQDGTVTRTTHDTGSGTVTLDLSRAVAMDHDGTIKPVGELSHPAGPSEADPLGPWPTRETFAESKPAPLAAVPPRSPLDRLREGTEPPLPPLENDSTERKDQ